MKKLRVLVLAILDKVDSILTTEPARFIGYGAAIVAFLLVQFLNSRGITRLGTNLSFDEAVAYAFGTLAFIVTAVETIRKFVYAPQTVIETVSDEFQNGHDLAHLEQDLKARYDEAVAAARAARAEAAPQEQEQKFAIPVGVMPPVDPERPN